MECDFTGGEGDGARAQTLEAWRELISRTFVELRPESSDPHRFCGRLDTRQRAGLTVSVVGGSRQVVRRGAAEIRRSPARRLFFIYQAEGRGRVEHEGGSLELSAGECVLVHPDRPYALGFDRSFRQVCVQAPEGRVRERAGRAIESAYGRPMARSQGLAQVLGAATRALLIDEDEAAGASELFLDVLGRALLARHAEPWGEPAAARRLRRFVAANHRREGLAPADAAAALGCSVRHVHRLCHAIGTTFGRLLLAERLAAAGRMLGAGDPSAARISDVAYDCGFSDLSHFSRAFRQEFGVSPRAYVRLKA